MAAGLVAGGPPPEPRDVLRGQLRPLAVRPRLRQRPLERPAVDRIAHERGHHPGSAPAGSAVDVHGPILRVSYEGQESLGVGLRWRLRLLARQPANVLEADTPVVFLPDGCWA